MTRLAPRPASRGARQRRAILQPRAHLQPRAQAASPRPLIGVHLDMKGVAFRFRYIPQLLADLASQGVNTLLVEYEYLFPFDRAGGIDIAYDPKVVWTRRQLASFLAEAARLGLEVIPLQQCLGHLEYVLGWRRYRRLALDRNYPSTIDVDNPRAVALVENLLRQVIQAHPQSRYVHLGMDEAHAMVTAAKRRGWDVVEGFFKHLDRLCRICEEYGKTPIIWSDMLEDHISPRNLKLFQGYAQRVVLMPWEYSITQDRWPVGRIAGFRVSRAWLDEPDNSAAPAITPGLTYVEDLPKAVRELVGEDYQDRYFTSMFQLDLWSRLGFRVIGASGLRSGGHLAVMPFYNRFFGNIGVWSRAVQRTGALGQVGTTWARGTSWGPNTYPWEMMWPLIHELGRTMGAAPPQYFKGVPAATVERIIKTLGRCRVDWRIEGRVAAEMEAISPKVKEHRYEWDSIALMARVLELQRRAEYNVLEVDHFHANVRPVESEWQRRIGEQKQTLHDLAAMRTRIVSHFARRYHGEAFAEWVRDLFDLHVRRINGAVKESREKLAKARRVYASKK